MRASTSVSVLLAAAGSLAAPLTPRHDTPAKPAITDADILNYALTLEHLEDKFYREGLANFTLKHFQDAGYDETFYNNLKEVSYDETTHVSFLTGALKAAGANPVAECKYAFGVTDVKSFVATASILEGVGVSAYIGAAASIVEKAYLTAAASIVTVESRHSSYFRGALKQSPFPQPFDAPLGLNEVYTLAAPFIVSCPESNGKLPVKAFPKVTLVGSAAVKTGSEVVLEVAGGLQGEGPFFAAWVSVTGGTVVAATKVDGCKLKVAVPMGFHGQSYVLITNKNATVTDDIVLAGPAIVEVSGASGAP